MPISASKLAREPLVHFLLLGAALFGLYGLRDADMSDGSSKKRIEISNAEIERLQSTWQLQWQRPPTEAELEGLINAHIREEILFREALALGLDCDDTIVRRRLAQKFEFLTQDLIAPPEPTSEQLAAYMRADSERYQFPASVSFSHIYFSTERHDNAEQVSRQALEQIRLDPGSAETMGDPFLLEFEFLEKSAAELEHQFGSSFVNAVLEAELGVWTGPVRSSFGWHLIKVGEVVKARMPELAEVEERVRRDWEAEERRRADDEVFVRLLARYEIVVEQPENPDSHTASAAERTGP